MLRNILLFALVVAALYGVLRLKRDELVDFAVPYTAAVRFQAQEPLYRPDDQHYQYKYFPAFAIAMIPFTTMPRGTAEIVWFVLTAAMALALLRLSIAALPDRRLPVKTLIWLTFLLTGKFFVKEQAFGQFNLPMALMVLGAAIAARHERPATAGMLVAASVFVKPYALILAPWLALRLGWRSLVPFALVIVGGLLLPAAWYGWDGNVTLLREWYRTVTETTAPNLMGAENMSFASMWAKWIGPGRPATLFAYASVAVAMLVGLILILRWRRVPSPDYLDVAYFMVLVPLVSPQGWDYVLLIALPAFVCLVDRWRELSPNWRLVALTGFFLTSFTIFDLVGRGVYLSLMQVGAVSVGAVLIAACLFQLRSRALA